MTANKNGRMKGWLALAGLLFAVIWPFPVVHLLGQRVPLHLLILIWTVLTLVSGLYLVTIHRKRRVDDGLFERGALQQGIAGKTRALPASRALIPIGALVMVAAVTAYPKLITPWTVLALLIIAKLLLDWTKTIVMEHRQHRRLLLRPILPIDKGFHDLAEKDVAMKEALDFIAETCGIPSDRIRPTDEFGKDIGLMSTLDPRLDLLGDELLRKSNDGGIDLTRILTVQDYMAAWKRSQQCRY